MDSKVVSALKKLGVIFSSLNEFLFHGRLSLKKCLFEDI